MFEYIILAIALLGTGLAGWQDLKTSGVEDKYPVFIGVSGILIHLANSYLTGVWSGFYHSIIIGLAFLAFGYIMYFANQWGEADVLILGALGFLIPGSLSIFAISVPFPYYAAIFLATVFIVGGIYSLLYSFVLALRTPGFAARFSGTLESYSGRFLNLSVILFIISILAVRYVQDNFYFLSDILLRQTFVLYLFFAAGFVLVSFSKAIDSFVFRKEVDTSDLCEGDVLAEKIETKDSSYSKKLSGKLFIGLETEDIEFIRKTKKKVWIKEGIPFVPTFFFSVIFVWLFGNVFSFLL